MDIGPTTCRPKAAYCVVLPPKVGTVVELGAELGLLGELGELGIELDELVGELSPPPRPAPDAPGADSVDGAGTPVVVAGALPFGVGTAPAPPFGP